ncbi:MAG: TonB-dependent receptor domain-containing protein, partial [Bradyrhizobium sp.]
VVGVFYEKHASLASAPLSDPGSPERAIAEGCTAPVYFGSTFPNCLLMTGPDDEAYNAVDNQSLSDKSVYGDLTYHFTRNWQVTGGVRYFREEFTDLGAQYLYDFGVQEPLSLKRSTFSKTVGKIDMSYEYSPGQHVYALWSQGFRRGGTNGGLLPTGAFADEAPATFKPDLVSNYEIGLKGHFANSLSYAVDGFYMPWTDPQICGLTPQANYACWNAKKAVSQGFELNLDSPLFLPGLRVMLVGTYANAHLTENYSYPDFGGNLEGYAGEQLPLSPKESGAATLSYTRDLGSAYSLVVTLNNTYTSAEVTNYFKVLGQKPANTPAMDVVNASVAVIHDAWRIGIYSTNLMNKYEVLTNGTYTAPLSFTQTINQPRMVYIGGDYSF